MPVAVEISTFLGAAVLLWTAYCLVVPGRRLLGIVVGSVGMLAGTLAALVYTLHHVRLGVDLDFIPHEPAAQWFVAVFGWAGLATALVASLVPSVKARLAGRIAP